MEITLYKNFSFVSSVCDFLRLNKSDRCCEGLEKRTGAGNLVLTFSGTCLAKRFE